MNHYDQFFPSHDSISNSESSSPAGSTGSYRHNSPIPGPDSIIVSAWRCGSFAAIHSSPSTTTTTSTTTTADNEEEGLEYHEQRGSKRIRLYSPPPRPSMCAKRFFHSSYRSNNYYPTLEDDHESQNGLAMPPSIQRLALPSLLHSHGADPSGQYQSRSTHCDSYHLNYPSAATSVSPFLSYSHYQHHQRNHYCTDSSPCPFGTQ